MNCNGVCGSVCGGGVAGESIVGVGSLNACATECTDLFSGLSPGRKGDPASGGGEQEHELGWEGAGDFSLFPPLPH